MSARDESLQMPKKSPLALLPLDSTVSLPPKAANLVLGSSTDEESERIDTLQAYQPIREGMPYPLQALPLHSQNIGNHYEVDCSSTMPEDLIERTEFWQLVHFQDSRKD